MKTVLIVEDEKLIRQGIRAMVQRSGVPVEIIMECNNGEAALEVLKGNPVDVMFTDIRMPKMDGIELVQKIQKLENKPLIVAVSGYDDFSYAVEMMRNGVREYILKPVERQRIAEVMQKLDQEIADREKQSSTDLRIGQNQLKLLLASETPAEEELKLLEQKYEERFFPEGYQVCVAGKGFVMEDRENTLFFDEMREGNLCIFLPELLSVMLKNELWQEYVGASPVHHGLREVKEAYREATEARHKAFFRMENVIPEGADFAARGGGNRVAEGLRKESRKQLDESAWLSRVHIIGTDKTEEIEGLWRPLFDGVKRERIRPEEFEQGMEGFFDELEKIYRNMLGDKEREALLSLRNLYQYSDVESYRDELMDFLLGLHRKINHQEGLSLNQQKMKQAVEYIREHYSEDLNMAVVSNYVSMNYSLFSYEFKQFTGNNFVNYLKELRMAEAKKLLAETDLKVIEISQRVGYENEKHFMKIFRNTCGVSPSMYRKNVGAGDAG